MMLSSVDLPEPEGPSSTTNWPSSSCRFTCLSACTSTSPMSYTLARSVIVKSGSDIPDSILSGPAEAGHYDCERSVRL